MSYASCGEKEFSTKELVDAEFKLASLSDCYVSSRGSSSIDNIETISNVSDEVLVDNEGVEISNGEDSKEEGLGSENVENEICY